MFQKLNLKIVLLVAVFTAAFGLVFMNPVQPNIAWATTCFYTYNLGGDIGDGMSDLGHFWIEDVNHEYYPCGHAFRVRHYGWGSSGSCTCNHQWTCVTLHICNPSSSYVEAYRTQMSLYTVLSDCGQSKSDETEWRVEIHARQAAPWTLHENRRIWAYYFDENGGGCRLPESGYYYFETDLHGSCYDAVWASKPQCAIG
jgi:hypothetical protein